MAAVPGATQAARANRAFMGRAVRYLARQGITQFLDIGSGLPTRGNVHQFAAEVSPGARVVYADIDPVVVAHARALLADSPAAPDKVTAIEADLRRPRNLITTQEIRACLDPEQPVGLLVVAVLHFITDGERPHDAVRLLASRLAPGSHVVVSHVTADHLTPGAAAGAAAVYDGASAPGVARTLDDIERFLDGLDLVPPGVTDAATWRRALLPSPARLGRPAARSCSTPASAASPAVAPDL
jgi:O-methyltransferase involved in polyketide biosynthesis